MSKIEFSNLPFRPCVGIFLVNKYGKVFVGKRIDSKTEAWQMPQGGVDEGENVDDAALRELKEETSVTSVKVIDQTDDWFYYDIPDSLIPNLWGGKYRGQKQKWFLMQFEGDESEVNIEVENQEFCEWKWVNATSLPDVIVPFKKQLYIDVLNVFKHKLDIK